MESNKYYQVQVAVLGNIRTWRIKFYKKDGSKVLALSGYPIEEPDRQMVTNYLCDESQIFEYKEISAEQFLFNN